MVAPLFPLDDSWSFAQARERACDWVILDHFLIGDGSPGGLRTRRSRFPEFLIAAGFERWTQLEILQEVEKVFREVFDDPERVGVSQAAFNQT